MYSAGMLTNSTNDSKDDPVSGAVLVAMKK